MHENTVVVFLRSGGLPKSPGLCAGLNHSFYIKSKDYRFRILHEKKERLVVVGEGGDGQIELDLILSNSPMPLEHIEMLATFSLWWRNAVESLRAHVATIRVSCWKESWSTLDNAIFLTTVVRQVVVSSEAIGVCWGDTFGTLSSEQDFLDLSKGLSREKIRPTLWTNIVCNLLQNDDYSLYTLGLARFQLPDLEIDKITTSDPAGVVAIVHSIISDALVGKMQLDDGILIPNQFERPAILRSGNSILCEEDYVLKIHIGSGVQRLNG